MSERYQPTTEAFEAVGRRKRVRLLPQDFRKYACARYQVLRSRGFTHGEATLLVQGEPEFRALPLWAMILSHLLFKLLLHWWENRDA